MEKLFSSVFLVLILAFFCLLSQFYCLGGLDFPLLKIIIDLIIILFLMIIFGKKKKISYFQKKIDEYFKTIK